MIRIIKSHSPKSKNPKRTNSLKNSIYFIKVNNLTSLEVFMSVTNQSNAQENVLVCSRCVNTRLKGVSRRRKGAMSVLGA
jgi:hypothetical protein